LGLKDVKVSSKENELKRLVTEGDLMSIFLSGYYGYGNLGDDIFLYVLIREFLRSLPTRKIFVLTSSADRLPFEVMKVVMKNKDRVEIRTIQSSKIHQYLLLLKGYSKKFVIFGGGTFLYDDVDVQVKNLWIKSLLTTYSRIVGSKIIGLGIGCDSLKHKSSAVYSRKILKNMDKVYFRDKTSFENAKKLYNCGYYKVIPDLAYLLYPDVTIIRNEKKDKESFTVGLNLATHSNDEKTIDWAISLMEKLKDSFQKVKIITAQNNQKSQEWKIRNVLLHRYPNTEEVRYLGNLSVFLRELSECDIVIGSKLHVVIAAHLLGIPCIALSYQQKVRSICEEIMHSEFIFDIPSPECLIVNKTKEINSSPMDYKFGKNASELYVALKDYIDKFLNKINH